jgi:hypothetical protein
MALGLTQLYGPPKSVTGIALPYLTSHTLSFVGSTVHEHSNSLSG